ncbi:MAG: biotin/lipoyl-binding protein [Rhodospirillales bacterium]
MNLEKQLDLAPPTHSPAPPPPRQRRATGRLALLALLVVGAGGGGAWWWTHRPPPLPAGILASNGRLEMDEIDIQTKFAGRVKEIMVDEGDAVRPGQVLARMDVADLNAELARAEAMIAQAEQTIAQGRADLVQAGTTVTLMQREVARTTTLLPKGFATQQTLDQQRQQLDAGTRRRAFRRSPNPGGGSVA